MGRLTSAWFEVDGVRMHARVGPDGGHAPLVLVHGLVISSRYMIPVGEALAADFHVLAPDLPGFGRSRTPAIVSDVPALAEWLRLWMDAAGLRRAGLLGNSLGCQVAAELAARHPQRVAYLVLSGPTYDPDARRVAPQIGRWLVDWLFEKPSLTLHHLVDYRNAGVRRALRTFRDSLADAIERTLPRVHAPTLVVRGAADSIVPRPWAERAARLLPHGRFVEIPGPHCSNYSAAQALASEVRAFAREVSRRFAGPAR